MAAFWNIVFPHEIWFEDSLENQELFDSKYKNDFVFRKINKYQVVREEPGNGSQKVFHHQEKQYFINPEIIKTEFKPFFTSVNTEFKNLFEEDLVQRLLKKKNTIIS